MMSFLRNIFISSLVLGAACVQFEIPQVEAVVAEIVEKLSPDDFDYPGLHLGLPTISPKLDLASLLPIQLSTSSYWYESIDHQGISAFGPSDYQVYRNVKDYGATGNGETDDTAAINAAISAGGRCGRGCASSTTTPAVVYFPAGTYLISSSIIDFYYTQLIGNPNDPPTLKATSNFTGFGLIDGNPYYTEFLNWKSTNVFMRQVRNFVLDLTSIPASTKATGMHWPTSQATSLQNVVFEMNSETGTQHTGLFIESGSAGLIVDVTFNGGLIGASVGNQQFTMRNLVFNNCVTAINQLWSWGWVYQGISINNCQRGIDVSNGGSSAIAVGSITLIDSTITDTPIGIISAYTSSSSPATAGSLIIENVQLNNVPTAIQLTDNSTVLEGTSGSLNIAAWGGGHQYTPNGPNRFEGVITPNSRPASLLSGSKYYVQSKPQYESLPASSFTSVRSSGAAGNGVQDDTYALQEAINDATDVGNIVFFDAGTYKVTSTIFIPAGARLVGESYSVIMSSGSYFNDQNSPKPVVRVGNAGDYGRVEWSDMIVATQGTQAGAILIEWNLAASGTPSGMWDVHTRTAGFLGSDLQIAQCPTTPSSSEVDTACIGAYMSMHVTPSASGLYMENCWLWTADHDIDDANNTQITVYSGRGMYIESNAGTIWLVGTGAEHHTLYQYQFANTKTIYMGFAQTETPYYQPNPSAPTPVNVVSSLNDPDFSTSCSGQAGNCASAWGLRIISSSDILIYGTGLYSFFNNYNTTCSNGGGLENCQENILSLEGSNSNVNFYNLITVGTTNMITVNGESAAHFSDNVGGFTDAIAMFRS